LQQYPSTQLPFWQSAASVHVPPLAFLPVQCPAVQVLPLWHALPLVQLVGQVDDVPSHRYGEQTGDPGSPAATTVHVPSLPVRLHASQAPAHAVSQQSPSTQFPLRHCSVARQAAPAASLGTHVPLLQYEVAGQVALVVQGTGQSALSPSQVSGAHEGLPALPEGITAQVPTELVRLQASQDLSQLLSQQTPSTQWLSAHSSACAQSVPSKSFFTHAPDLQKCCASQSALPAHEVGHAAEAPSQR
jgi:hypothetical protein